MMARKKDLMLTLKVNSELLEAIREILHEYPDAIEYNSLQIENVEKLRQHREYHRIYQKELNKTRA